MQDKIDWHKVMKIGFLELKIGSPNYKMQLIDLSFLVQNGESLKLHPHIFLLQPMQPLYDIGVNF